MQNNNNIIYMKNEKKIVENVVAPAPKLFSNEIVQRRNGPQRKWNCSTEMSCSQKLHMFEFFNLVQGAPYSIVTASRHHFIRPLIILWGNVQSKEKWL